MPATSHNPKGNSVIRHPEYFFPEADVTFRVSRHTALHLLHADDPRFQAEDVLFRVHKRFFLRESLYFRTLFTAPALPCTDPAGSSETNPVVLKDTSGEAFSWLLWVFYNPYSFIQF
jgi:hypothetical protein